jgi:hypothetical protein
VPRVQDSHLECQGADGNDKSNQGKPLHPIALLFFVVHLTVTKKKNVQDTYMRAVQELLIGSAVFMLIDRFSRLVSNHMVAHNEVTEKNMIRIEIMVLVIVMLIAWKVF